MTIDKTADIVPISEWAKLRNAHFFHFDGGGKFVRDGEYVTSARFDDVFGSIPPEVTHIAWFNRWRMNGSLVPISQLRSLGE